MDYETKRNMHYIDKQYKERFLTMFKRCLEHRPISYDHSPEERAYIYTLMEKAEKEISQCESYEEFVMFSLQDILSTIVQKRKPNQC